MKNIPGTSTISGAIVSAATDVQESLRRLAANWKSLLGTLIAAMVFAVLAGYLAATYSAGTIQMMILSGVILWSIFRWPRWGLVLILIFTSTILVPEFFYPYAKTSQITNFEEIIMLMIIASSFNYWAQNHKKTGIFERLFSSPVMIALTIFLVIVLIKSMEVIIGSRFAHDSISSMYDFDHGITYFLLTIAVVLLLDDRKRLRWMTGVFFLLGTIVAVRVLLEMIFPHWGIWTSFSAAEPLAIDSPAVDMSVLRLRTAGGTIMLVCFWTGVMSMVLQPWTFKRLAFYLPVTLVMLSGLILEFNRSYILPMAGLFVLATLLNRKNASLKLVTLAAVAVLAVLSIAALTGTMQTYIDAAGLRFGTALSSQALESQSIISRQIEQDFAFQAIGNAPFFGIGLDQLYRPPVPGMMDNLRWYIHNSYLWFWVYFGLFGLLAFLAVIFTAMWRAAFNWQRTSDPLLQAFIVGAAFSLATLLPANFAAPKFYDYMTVPTVALMLGMIEAIILSERHGDHALQ